MSRRTTGSSQATTSSPLPSRDWSAGWIFAGIFLAALLAYWPALSGGFIWDDEGHVTRADLRGLSGLFRIWTEFGATQQYYPILHSAFWLEHRFWGDAPLGYHLLNVLLHSVAACLFGTLLRRLAVPGATLAAFLFALHPVCVESVAWISEQKNTLSLVFYLCAALAYLRFTERHRSTDYMSATGLFILALLTKTVTASLPAALLVVIWWQRGRLEWKRDVLPLLPWFALGAVSGLVTAHFERVLIGAQGQDFALGLMERCLLAGRVVWFYLGKLVWPVDLIFIYPRWTVDASIWWQWLFLPAALALLAGLVWWHRQRGQRAPLAVALLFAGSLFPVLGFVNVFPFLFSYVADHFQYLASLSVFALAGAGFMNASVRVPRWGQIVTTVILLAGLGCLSWKQSKLYRDNLTLYQSILERNPACWMAHNNLATTLLETGRSEEAKHHLEYTLRLHPDYILAENNLGLVLNRLNRPQEAIPHLEKATRLEPRFFQAHYNLGSAFMALNRLPESLAEFELALKHQPKYPEAEYNLGLVLARLERTGEAIAHFDRALQLKPDYADAELSWGIALMLTGQFPEAVIHFERAISLYPANVEFRRTYARALVQAGRYPEALLQYEKAVELDPEDATTQMNLALGLRQAGRLKEAGEHYQEAIRLNPDLARRQ